MLKTLAKLLAFKKAPKKTFFLLSPLRATKWLAGLWLVRKIWGAFGGGKSR